MLGLKAVNIASTSNAPLKTPRVTILALLQASEGRVTVICPRNSKAPLKQKKNINGDTCTYLWFEILK